MRFVLVDDIVDLMPGRSVVAVKTLDAGEEIFRDHFPGFAVVPGVPLTEMIAQAAGKCLDAEDLARGKAMLVQIRQASFRKWVRPGQRAEIKAEISSSGQSYGVATGQVSVDGEEVARAELLFTFVPHSQFAPGFRDSVLDRYLTRRREVNRDDHGRAEGS